MALELHQRARACGKVILLGEHSVVYGYPALAAGLSDALELEAEPRADRSGPMQVSIPGWEVDVTLHADTEHPVARACLEVLGTCDGPLTGWTIRGATALPARAGLGSSAALTVALARLALGPTAAIEDVVEASMAGERVFHGEPSGIDSEVAARGGVLRFVRGERPEPVELRHPLRLVIVPSGVPRSTATQVARVRETHDRLPMLGRPMLETLGVAVGRGLDAIKQNDLKLLGWIMSIAHELLSGLGVSSRILDELCSTARDHGALGAKLTGAGGGGCILALPPPDPGPIVAAFRDRGLDAFVVDVTES